MALLQVVQQARIFGLREGDGHILLMLAASRGHVHLIRALLAAGVPVDAHLGSPLSLAARLGHVGAISTLCDGGANIDVDGGRPLRGGWGRGGGGLQGGGP